MQVGPFKVALKHAVVAALVVALALVGAVMYVVATYISQNLAGLLCAIGVGQVSQWVVRYGFVTLGVGPEHPQPDLLRAEDEPGALAGLPPASRGAQTACPVCGACASPTRTTSTAASTCPPATCSFTPETSRKVGSVARL
jgi:hypothetical protein